MASRSENSGPVLVTGATGFVGAHFVRKLQSAGTEVRILARGDLERIGTGEGLTAPLHGCRGVVHLAARAHVLEDTSETLLDIYRRVNRDATLMLAREAAKARTPRFVFVSSIRVNGSASSRPFKPNDAPHPDEPYAISKYEAELGLRHVEEEMGLEVVVIRPPLVYGPGVKANFRKLLGLAASGVPLPLASIDGLRSLIGVHNLCDLLRTCLDHRSAPGRTLLVSDGEDIALPALIRELAAGMERPARLFPMPPSILRAFAALAGKGATFDKLTASLQIDASETFEALSWRPPMTLRDGLQETARWFAKYQHSAIADVKRSDV